MPNDEGNNGNANPDGNTNLDNFQFSAADLGIKDPTPEDKVAQDKATAELLEKTNKEAADKLAAELAAKNNIGDGNQEEYEAVELEGVQYKLDKDGNALGEDGKIFKTKAELDSLESENTEPLIDVYSKLTGITPKDENGNPIKYEDTEEGFIKYNKDVAKIQAKKEFDSLINSDPEIKQFYEHKRRGGTLDDFVNTAKNSWTRVKFDDANEELHKSLIIAQQMKSGVSKEEAEQIYNLLKDTGKAKQHAKAAHGVFINEEKIAIENKAKEDKETYDKYVEDNTNYWEKTVKPIVTSGKIGNIVIPESDRDAFFAYIALPVKDGYSQEQLDKLTEEQLLQQKYQKFKKFDISQMITSGVNKSRVKTIRDRVTVQSSNGGGEGINKDNHQKADLDISLKSTITGKSK